MKKEVAAQRVRACLASPVACAVRVGRSARPFILSLLYFVLTIFSYVALPALALLGLADSLMPIRRRGSVPPPPPSP